MNDFNISVVKLLWLGNLYWGSVQLRDPSLGLLKNRISVWNRESKYMANIRESDQRD